MTEQPWLDEPDNAHVISQGYHGYVIRVPRLLHLCGYVSVPKSHPAYGGSAENDLDVHGGITYSSDHLPNHPPDGSWWYGFDCAHAGDLVPGATFRIGPSGTYRTIGYAITECLILIRQLRNLRQ